jgi:ankyrin repeat protein
VLAQFAFKTYTDYKKRDTNAHYETRLALPDGWKLLTTASNGRRNNGYFGAAYWHPEHQQVVIAHRGTDTKSLGAIWTDLKGVELNQYVRQMDSASTFAHKVVQVLREVSRMKGVSFQLYFTGHSLGGWLAQITTFTTKYLKVEGNTFLKRDNIPQSYHPHTVVFDSPGCKMMLSQMKDTFDVRLDGRSISLKHLDITTYLSAPNRINTRQSHLGTVFRIFPDFSDMGWWEKRTVLYDVMTNSLDRILEAFDPETGQVHRDEQGRLKVQVVVDWPVTFGTQRGKEYDRFFKWARDLNHYHPDITDITLPQKGYHPLRYQTKIYDEQVSSLNVFSQEECQFLQDYYLLRQSPELFKSKELFSVMNDNQAQEDAEKILQGFEIEKDKIRCTDPNALQTLAPYVKRLLQLFPKLKEIRNKVYQCETSNCIEQMKQSPLDFNPDALSVRDFLEDEQQQVLQVHMIDCDEWTGLMKVYQVLQNTNSLIEGQYTVLKLDRLLTLNMLMDFRTSMQSIKAPHLILVACEINQLLKAETKYMMRTFFETMKQIPFIKTILTTRAEDIASHFLRHVGGEIFGNGFVTRDEKLTWHDLTSISQKKLLEKSVKFQGTTISLNEIMSAESPVANYLPLGALLEEKDLKIADPLPISNDYNESYYIGRTLHHQTAIKQDILNDKDVRDSYVYLASTEQEFKQFCQQNPKSNIHWLEKDKSGKLVWQQSQGSLETLRRYIDNCSSHKYTPDDLDKLLEQAQHQRVMLISDTAGMGKSTLLTHLSKQIREKFPVNWVVRIDLNDHTAALNALKQEQIDKEKVIEFVSEKLLKLKPGLEMELFKQRCEQKQKVRIVIMFDGFDKISPFYKETVIDLLQALRQTAVEQLWVTTRPHLREELEDKLQQLSYTLEPFSEGDQVAFLRKFWSLNYWFTEPEEDKRKLEIYAEHLIKNLAYSISDKDREFTGIPLQTRMLAEAFDREVKIFYQSAECMPELPITLDLLGLYERFIERKYDIYQEEKLQISVTNVAAMALREYHFKTLREEHQLLALKVLFTEEQVALFQKIRECSFSTEDLTRTGIVQLSDDGKPHFIHRTFAEYYVADCLVNRLTEGNKTSEQVLDFILKDIFMKGYYQVTRVFIDGLLSRSNLSDEVLKQCGNRIHDLGNECVTILHQSVFEGKADIIRFLLDSVQAGGHTDTVIGLLLAHDKYRRNAWHVAALGGNLQVLEKLWEWAKENLTKEEISNHLLLATDNTGKTAWHMAAENGKLAVLQKIWERAKENLTTEEINNKLLLATDDMGKTAWHMAAENGELDVLQKILERAKENLTREEINSKLLLTTENKGRTVWQVAVKDVKLGVLQKMWEWAKENLTTEEIKYKLLLPADDKGMTILHVAAKQDKLTELHKIWEWAKRNLTREEMLQLGLVNQNEYE